MLTFKAIVHGNTIELHLVKPTYEESVSSDDYLINEGIMTIANFSAPTVKQPDLSLKERIETRYHSIGGFNFIKDVTIGSQGQWNYPGDPVVEPLFKFIDFQDEHLYFYRYSLLAIKNRDEDGYFTTRID